MYYMGVTVNIMSIAGIAISIGVLVDGAIVEVENAYNKLHLWEVGGRKGDFHAVRLEALQEVGPSVFFSLLVIAVAFLPIFALVDQEGRLFKPLAYSKNLAMAIAALLAITLDPAMRMLFTRMDPFTFRPRWLARLATTVAGRHVLRRGAAPDQPGHLHASTTRPAASCCGIPKTVIAAALAGRRRQRPGVLQARLRVHAAAERGHDPLHAHDAGRASRSPRRRTCCSGRTRSSGGSPRWRASWARRGAPKRPPTRRRSP